MKGHLHLGTWRQWGHPSEAGKMDEEARVSANRAGLVPGPSKDVCFQGDWPRLFISVPVPGVILPGKAVGILVGNRRWGAVGRPEQGLTFP